MSDQPTTLFCFTSSGDGENVQFATPTGPITADSIKEAMIRYAKSYDEEGSAQEFIDTLTIHSVVSDGSSRYAFTATSVDSEWFGKEVICGLVYMVHSNRNAQVV